MQRPRKQRTSRALAQLRHRDSLSSKTGSQLEPNDSVQTQARGHAKLHGHHGRVIQPGQEARVVRHGHKMVRASRGGPRVRGGPRETILPKPQRRRHVMKAIGQREGHFNMQS